MVRAVGFEPTASCFQGRSSGRAELHPVEKLALRREIESLSPDRQSGRLTRCVTELERKLVRLGRLERPLNALSTHSLCRLGYRRLEGCRDNCHGEGMEDQAGFEPAMSLRCRLKRPARSAATVTGPLSCWWRTRVVSIHGPTG